MSDKEEIKREKHREAQRQYYKKRKEKLNNPDCEQELKDKYEKMKNYKKEKYKEYYEEKKDVINDKYHEKKEKEGIKTNKILKVPKSKEDKFNIALKLLTDIEMTLDDKKILREKFNI